MQIATEEMRKATEGMLTIIEGMEAAEVIWEQQK
jgi:hypothetical protein